MGRFAVWWSVATFVLAALLGAPLRAQVSGIQVEVPQEFAGLGGVLRPGSWTPVRVTLSTPGEANRPVLVQWRLRDHDGDEVLAERRVVLNPNREQHIWLYGVPPVNTPADATWSVQVLDAETGELLATQTILAARRESAAMSIIGVLGSAGLGLDPYTGQYTQHEPIGILRGLNLETLPDRWYGLDLLHSLIWVSDGGDPNAPAISAPMQAALREWVRRGGHLVLVLPAFAEPWTGSPFADLLPVPAEMMRRVEGPVPRFLWDVDPQTEVQMTVFDLPPASRTAVLERTDAGEPVVVAGRYGFGRVTLLGVDLNDARLKRLDLPAGKFRIWNTVYGWNSEVLLEQSAQAKMADGKLSRPEARATAELGAFIPGQIAMTGRAASKLLLAIGVFIVYWLASGPLGFYVLKRRGQVRKSWLVFVATVALFAAISWGGALLLQDRDREVAHFSVLDIDARTGLMRTQSWLSLFIPEFGRVEVAVAPGEESEQVHNTMTSAGLLAGPESTTFLDPQPYVIDAGSPNEISAGVKPDREFPVGLPVRATAKQFEVRYLGAIGEGVEGITAPWVPPQGEVRIGNDGFPAGTLAHNLPGQLQNVLAVYVPAVAYDPEQSAGLRATRSIPWVWRIGAWAPQQPIELTLPPNLRANRAQLVRRLPNYEVQRSLNMEGFLGALMSGTPSIDDANLMGVGLAKDQKVKFIEMLSFFDILPPPDVYQSGFGGPVVFHRAQGRGLDLSAHVTGAKLILIGHLESSPLPVPLVVDGEPVESRGWTVVRWIYDL